MMYRWCPVLLHDGSIVVCLEIESTPFPGLIVEFKNIRVYEHGLEYDWRPHHLGDCNPDDITTENKALTDVFDTVIHDRLSALSETEALYDEGEYVEPTSGETQLQPAD